MLCNDSPPWCEILQLDRLWLKTCLLSINTTVSWAQTWHPHVHTHLPRHILAGFPFHEPFEALSESMDGHIFHTWLSHQFHPPSASFSLWLSNSGGQGWSPLTVPSAGQGMNGRWGVDWYLSRETEGDERQRKELGPPPPFIPATVVHTWSELGLNMSGGWL